METKTLIQSTATIIRVTSLEKGNVYKRLEESSYGTGSKLLFGIVTEIMNTDMANGSSLSTYPNRCSRRPLPTNLNGMAAPPWRS